MDDITAVDPQVEPPYEVFPDGALVRTRRDHAGQVPDLYETGTDSYVKITNGGAGAGLRRRGEVMFRWARTPFTAEHYVLVREPLA